MLIGAARAIGRNGNEQHQSLFLRLFPAPPPPPSSDMSQENSKRDSRNSTNSLVNRTGSMAKKLTLPPPSKLMPVPATLSTSATWTGGLVSKDSNADLQSLSSMVASHTRESSFLSHDSRPGQRSTSNSDVHYFFTRIGSCFSQLQKTDHRPSVTAPRAKKRCSLSVSQLQTILSLAKKVLDTDMLHTLDELATDTFMVFYC